jgi:hypothetical protein
MSFSTLVHVYDKSETHARSAFDACPVILKKQRYICIYILSIRATSTNHQFCHSANNQASSTTPNLCTLSPRIDPHARRASGNAKCCIANKPGTAHHGSRVAGRLLGPLLLLEEQVAEGQLPGFGSCGRWRCGSQPLATHPCRPVGEIVGGGWSGGYTITAPDGRAPSRGVTDDSCRLSGNMWGQVCG